MLKWWRTYRVAPPGLHSAIWYNLLGLELYTLTNAFCVHLGHCLVFLFMQPNMWKESDEVCSVPMASEVGHDLEAFPADWGTHHPSAVQWHQPSWTLIAQNSPCTYSVAQTEAMCLESICESTVPVSEAYTRSTYT